MLIVSKVAERRMHSANTYTYLSIVLVAKVCSKLRRRIQIAQELRVEGEHDDADGDKHGPANCGWVQLHSLPERKVMLVLDGLGKDDMVGGGATTLGVIRRVDFGHCDWGSSRYQSGC